MTAATLAPPKPAPTPRQIIAESRDRIRLASRARDLDALREVRDSLARLTMLWVARGGGPGQEIAIVGMEAQDALELALAIDSYPRSVRRKQWSMSPMYDEAEPVDPDAGIRP